MTQSEARSAGRLEAEQVWLSLAARGADPREHTGKLHWFARAASRLSYLHEREARRAAEARWAEMLAEAELRSARRRRRAALRRWALPIALELTVVAALLSFGAAT